MTIKHSIQPPFGSAPTSETGQSAHEMRATNDLKYLVCERDERSAVYLPQTCIRCGQGGMPLFQNRTWFPFWGYFACLIPFIWLYTRQGLRVSGQQNLIFSGAAMMAALVIYLIIRRKVHLRYALCANHLHQNRSYRLLFFVSAVIGVTLALLKFFILALLMIPAICILAFLYMSVIGIKTVTGKKVWIKGCKPAFLTQFPRG